MITDILNKYEQSLNDPLYSYDYLYLHIDYNNKIPIVKIGKNEKGSKKYVKLNGFDKNESCFALLVRLALGVYESENGFIHKDDDLKISHGDKELVGLRKILKMNKLFNLTERQKKDLIKASKDMPRYVRLAIPRGSITIKKNINHFKSRLREYYEKYRLLEIEYQEEYHNAKNESMAVLVKENMDVASSNAKNMKKAIDKHEWLISESYKILKKI